MSFIENIGYILLGFIGIISTFLIVLGLFEKKLHISLLKNKFARNHFYIERISKLNINTPKESLRLLSKIARNFFREAFHIKGNPEYSELKKYFENKNNRKATQFCDEIVKLIYSKQEVTKEKIQELITILAEIISSNKIITKEQKEELDKKSKKAEPLLRQIHIPGISKKKFKDEKTQTKN